MMPRTRGSTTTVRPVMTPMVRATASISAPTKFSVIGFARFLRPCRTAQTPGTHTNTGDRSRPNPTHHSSSYCSPIQSVDASHPAPSIQGNDRQATLPAPDNVQQIAQHRLVFSRRTSLPAKVPARPIPSSSARKLKAAFQCLQFQLWRAGQSTAGQTQAVTAYRPQCGQP